MKRSSFVVVLLLLAAAPAMASYNIVLKSGAVVFAREKYTVKGKKAIITQPNGTVVSYDLDQIDVPATEKYNKENPGNVIALQTGEDAKSARLPLPTAPPATTLQDVIKRRKVTLGEAPPKKEQGDSSTSSAFQVVEPIIDQAFHRIFDGASITQYRVAGYRGKVRLLATVNTEEAVFNTIAATARVVSDLVNRGKEVQVEIVLTTSSGDSGGTFEMSPEHARNLINGNITTADYFIKNVVL